MPSIRLELLAGILWTVIQAITVSHYQQKTWQCTLMLNKLSVTNTKNPPSRPITDLEAVWKLIIPATLSLARIITVTVSKLGRIRLPPSVWTRLIMILSLSSGSGSSKMVSVTIFFVSPTSRRTQTYLCVHMEKTLKRLNHLFLQEILKKYKKGQEAYLFIYLSRSYWMSLRSFLQLLLKSYFKAM